MSVEVSDIIVSPASIWLAPAGEALPDETTVLFGGAWGGNWADLGPTTTPVTLAHSRDEFEVELEQFTLPVDRVPTKESFMFEMTLAQLTPATLAKAINGTATNTPAAAAQRAYDEIVAGGEFTLTKYVIGVEGRYRSSSGAVFPVRAFLKRSTLKFNGNLQFAKGGVSGIPLQASALADTTAAEGEQAFVMHRVTAAATTEA